MTRVVVDASVAVKWVLAEAHSDNAAQLLTDGYELCVPGHWLAEVTTALWAKTAVHAALTQPESLARIGLICDVIVQETPIRELIASASEAAFDLHLTVYDTLYLVLARRIGSRLVTADRKLYGKAKADPRFADLALWIGDLPAAGH